MKKEYTAQEQKMRFNRLTHTQPILLENTHNLNDDFDYTSFTLR